jgi:hypothetical protein
MFVGFICWSKGKPAGVTGDDGGRAGERSNESLKLANTRAARTRSTIERAHAPLFA